MYVFEIHNQALSIFSDLMLILSFCLKSQAFVCLNTLIPALILKHGLVPAHGQNVCQAQTKWYLLSDRPQSSSNTEKTMLISRIEHNVWDLPVQRLCVFCQSLWEAFLWETGLLLEEVM